MRQIVISHAGTQATIEVTQELVKHIASRRSLPADSISDNDIVKFFADAAGQALDRAVTEYVASDGKTS